MEEVSQVKQEYKPYYEKFGLNVVYYRKRKKSNATTACGIGRYRQKSHQRHRAWQRWSVLRPHFQTVRAA